MKSVEISNVPSSHRFSHDAMSEAFQRHDALVKARWRRAIILSCAVNVVAWSAFALSKTTSLLQSVNESLLQGPMQWTITVAPTSRLVSQPTKTTALSGSRISQRSFNASAIAFSGAPLSSRTSSQSLSNSDVRLKRTESQLAKTHVFRIPPPQNSLQKSGATRAIIPMREQNLTVASGNKNTSWRNVYPQEHSDHSRDSTNAAVTSTRATGAITGSQNRSAPSGKNTANANSAATSSAEGASNNSGSASANTGMGGSGGGNDSRGSGSSENGSSPHSLSGRSVGSSLPDRPLVTEHRNSLPQHDEPEKRIAPSLEPVALPEKPRVQETPVKVELASTKPRIEATPVVPSVRKRVVKEAEIVSQKNVRVPRHLRKEKIKKSVRVEFDIDEKGKASPRVTESSGDKELDEVVLKAARKTRFKPREEDGVATKSTKKTRYEINIDDNEKGSNNDDDE